MMDNCTVFVSSADSYSDLWDIFFDLFEMYWPEYDGEIVLNTQKKEYHHEGLNIRCTKVGKLKGFGATFRAGLEKVKTDNVLVIMIDFIFMGKVNSDKMDEYFKYFVNSNLGTLYLCHFPFTYYKQSENKDILIAEPNSSIFEYQVVFWKKSILYQVILPHEDPWMSEWYGSRRTDLMNISTAYLSDSNLMPIKYNAEGCIHQGLWLDDAVEFLDNNYDKKVDFSIRGYYKENPVYNSFSFRVKLKLNIWKTGLKGSYWDLIKRKCLM